MFSKDQLSSLSQLKQDIRESKDIQQGMVRGTSGRYGFVSIADGRDAFLNPEQMDRVFPGDSVEIEVTTKTDKEGKEKYEAKLLKLLQSNINIIAGRYRVRGKGHFIATDLIDFSRWIFIPPKDRKKCEEGQYAIARISQHPFKDGRAQAKIINNIGNDDTPFIERLYTQAKYQLDAPFSAEVNEQANTLAAKKVSIDNDHQRQDLRNVDFVTIDSASTQDMDDALYVEESNDGWRLSVAIADPGADIAPGSALDIAASKRAQTVYFPGKPLPMLPEQLSVDRYSLQCNKERLSLVFQCDITKEGQVNAFTFIPSIISSKAKLSYTQVAAFINDNTDADTKAQSHPNLSDITPYTNLLNALHQCTVALNAYRQKHHIVHHNKPDFALYLNEKGKLNNIEKIERNVAHTIVEEAMLVTNRCAGDYLARHQTGIYVDHQGYRPERRSDIENLLNEKTNTTIHHTDQLEHFVSAIKKLQSHEDFHALLSIQQRFLEASQLNNQAKPHFGLGFKYYATITSPIRRYQDLYNQRLIHQLLSTQSSNNIDDHTLAQLKVNLSRNRDAVRFMEQWLISDYMTQYIGQTFTGTVSLLTNQGVGIRLDNTGIEGFIPAKRPNKKQANQSTSTDEKSTDKISFNNQRMELFWNNEPITLDQSVSVTLVKIDQQKKKLEFSWTK